MMRGWLLLGLISLLPRTVSADEEGFVPGLRATFVTESRTVTRVDENLRLSFDLGGPTPNLPDERLTAPPDRVRWESLFLIRQNSNYKFHARVRGKVRLLFDGEVVLAGASDPAAEAKWISSTDLPLTFGDHEFACEFERSADDTAGELQLFWSAEAFPFEPIPPESFFREEPHTPWNEYERGRAQFVAWRCQSCHAHSEQFVPLPAPSLKPLKEGQSVAELMSRLLGTAPADEHSRMPRFDFNAEEALAIAAYLRSSAEVVDLKGAPKSKDFDKDVADGKMLVHSRGCLACHKLGEFGNDDLFAGPALDKLGSRASPAWIHQWLRDPRSLDPESRMPKVDLPPDELRQVTRYLQSLAPPPPPAEKPLDLSPAVVARGKSLIEAARCANCHQINGIAPNRDGIPRLTELSNRQTACVGPGSTPSKTRPRYEHPQRLATASLARFIAESKHITGRTALVDRALVLLEAKNCIQCHERSGSKGIAPVAGRVSQAFPELNGQSEAMIPPSLREIGDKLLDESLQQSIAGRQPRRMTWLHLRMPRYEHAVSEQNDLLAYFKSADRIPADAPDPRLHPPGVETPADAETLLLGNTLVGPKGFSCVACHELGSYKPRNVALGTHGSDLLNIGKRMRPEYFIRWTRAPIRIVPGMEMPSIGHKPIAGVLDGDIERQLVTIWQGLNHPDFTIPTNPASVEQFFVVGPNSPPRIVRDVFTIPQQDGSGYVARAFAVGFPNSHNLLFDLDRFELRQWTYGDFARQRTEGKSWYWDMAGKPIVTLDEAASGFLLLRDGKTIPPELRDARAGTLASYTHRGEVVALTYDLNFKLDDRRHSVSVTEHWLPLAGPPAGWCRTFELSRVPAGYQLMLQQPRIDEGVPHEIRCEPTGDVREIDGKRGFVLDNQTTISYLSPLTTPQLPIQPLPPLVNAATPIRSVPGFKGVRLPLDGAIMPTAIGWDADGRLIFTSLKGHLFRARDTNADGLPDNLQMVEEGLSAPYGVIADGRDLLVAHKPEILRLIDSDGDGTIDERRVFATGWGHSDNYHDWTCGIVRDADNNLYVGLGSDYAQPKRPLERTRWRGSILRIAPDGTPTPIAHSFRYPTGLAFDAHGRLFATDNQGVQNTFNELNHIREGKHYGVPSRNEPSTDAPPEPPAIQIPHPWSRSINGIAFVPRDSEPLAPIAGHGIGCEYDSRFLIRFTLQEVDGLMQGATYHFSVPGEKATPDDFVGPISIGISPTGEILIGSIHDSGWLGGQNTGAIEKLTFSGEMPNGIRELTATPEGFRIEFFHPVDAGFAQKERYLVTGYTRLWGGAYATPDSNRHRADVTNAQLADDGKTVQLKVEGRREGFVYEVTAQHENETDPLWPATGHYTLHRIPK